MADKEQKSKAAVIWLRQDLRLADNPTIRHAIDSEQTPYFVYIFAPDEEGKWAPGGASKVWLHKSLEALAEDIAAKGSKLHLFKAGKGEHFKDTETVLKAVLDQTGARSLYWGRRYEPLIIERDTKIKATFKELDIDVHTFKSSLLKEPWEVQTKEGKPFQVFTPFWRSCLNELHPDPPTSAPRSLPECQHKKLKGEVTLEALDLLPTIHWDKGIKESWEPGEKGALKQLKKFLKQAVSKYPDDRNRPDLEGVSRLSPHLHFGEVSPVTVWYHTKEAVSGDKKISEAAAKFLREIGWREFSHHLLYHFPDTTDKPLRKEFGHFPWRKNKKYLHAWQKGLTGYPIVDAGMRELWHTGIMHNRVRMVAASFLIKHLLQPWQDGSEWFWDTLVDADLAQNSLGWQWTAGCGADSAPYFRIFNPVLQGEKFDTEGDYVKRWVPEIAALGKKYIHKPWEAPQEVLDDAGIALGETYPRPIVDHGKARAIALQSFQELKAFK